MTRFYHSLAVILTILLSSLTASNVAFATSFDSEVRLRSLRTSHHHDHHHVKAEESTRWAVLVAGSVGYENYRHQADVCHAYQVLKKGGLKDENIIVFMYDDIAFNTDNPRPGVILNHPLGEDVYAGVPKDYTNSNATIANLFAVLLGNQSALTGGSGKVVNSGPNDHIFIFYSDHGGAGMIEMPGEHLLYAKDLIDVLKKKHEAKAFKSMVIYMESCESGSMFEGLLPDNLNIYAMTASSAQESSYGTYCPGEFPAPPTEYDTCLGDLFSIAWLEDSDKHDMRNETIKKQFEVVRRRTATDRVDYSSHVTRYGTKHLNNDVLFNYIGTNPANTNYTLRTPLSTTTTSNTISLHDQRDADLVHYYHKYHRAAEGSTKKFEAKNKLDEKLSHRRHVDESIQRITTSLFGNYSDMLDYVRPAGKAVVDDWDCFKTMMDTYKKYCGSLSSYGLKYTRVFANMCNVGVEVEQMIIAATKACSAS